MGLITDQSVRATIIDGTTAVTINGGKVADTKLLGVNFLVALTGTCVIAGFKKRAGQTDATGTITFPAASAAGFRDLGGIVNEDAALTVTCSNATDDEDVVIIWAPNT